MSRLAFCFLVLIASTAAAAELYKWTDENGVVHYTDRAPQDQEFEKRELVPEKPAPAALPAADRERSAAPSAGCEQARKNLVVFEKSVTVQMDINGDGTAETLEGEAKERELERTRELVKTLCAN